MGPRVVVRDDEVAVRKAHLRAIAAQVTAERVDAELAVRADPVEPARLEPAVRLRRDPALVAVRVVDERSARRRPSPRRSRGPCRRRCQRSRSRPADPASRRRAGRSAPSRFRAIRTPRRARVAARPRGSSRAGARGAAPRRSVPEGRTGRCRRAGAAGRRRRRRRGSARGAPAGRSGPRRTGRSQRAEAAVGSRRLGSTPGRPAASTGTGRRAGTTRRRPAPGRRRTDAGSSSSPTTRSPRERAASAICPRSKANSGHPVPQAFEVLRDGEDVRLGPARPARLCVPRTTSIRGDHMQRSGGSRGGRRCG